MLNLIPKTLVARRLSALAICTLVAFMAAFASTRSFSLTPPGMKPRTFQVAGAAAHIFVDVPTHVVGDGSANSNDFDTLWRRTVLMGDLATSDVGLKYVGRIAGVDPSQIAGTTRITANVPTIMTEPDSERRADQIASDRKPYRVDIQPSQNLTTLNVFTQAPSIPEAERLANAVAPALTAYLRDFAADRKTVPKTQVTFHQTGVARGAMLGSGKKMVAGLAFLLGFGLAAALLALIRRRWLGPPILPAAVGADHTAGGRGSERRIALQPDSDIAVWRAWGLHHRADCAARDRTWPRGRVAVACVFPAPARPGPPARRRRLAADDPRAAVVARGDDDGDLARPVQLDPALRVAADRPQVRPAVAALRVSRLGPAIGLAAATRPADPADLDHAIARSSRSPS